MTYTCLHCSRTFATPYALKRHIFDKHKYTDEDEGETSCLNLSYKKPGLWDDDLLTKEPGLWDLLPKESIWDDLLIEVRS